MSFKGPICLLSLPHMAQDPPHDALLFTWIVEIQTQVFMHFIELSFQYSLSFT